MVESHMIHSELFVLINEIHIQMLDHRTAHCRAMTLSQCTHFASNSCQQQAPATTSGNASQAIHRGMTKLHALRQAATTSRTGLPSSNGSESRSSTPALSAEPVESEGEKEQREQANDLVIVKDEFERYIRLGVLDAEADNLDLDLHWEVSI